MMTIIKILRIEQTSTYTIGVLSIDTVTMGFTLEPPNQSNQSNLSHILPGNYLIKKYQSPRFKQTCIKLYSVYGRDYISIHPGNKIKHTKGCILPGMQVKIGRDGLVQVNKSSQCMGNILFSFRDIATLIIQSIY